MSAPEQKVQGSEPVKMPEKHGSEHSHVEEM